MSTTPAPSKPLSSENIVAQKYDRCLADLLVKAGVGFSVGIVASVILFKRRAWPIALSTGFGAGAAYADCDRSFNPARIPGVRVIPTSPIPSATPAATPEGTREV
ncbi:uncharacterized protein PHACADRAFT_119257 [Phanerochaete carnosa HHB-10118-sp]|uniref:MICOS complex subunit MIC10 n=1 Tax=Phanerochaete carnosa (strain HHB-10118-sp) TaxID=650164 RepID=K5X2N8_PHACS|nr:uncharacterized protein PHACADRAFT_119257 [Phanerochaete carnosa HHB-10118-sp]EKM57072.1 hypothetical protein PHACADRAFT_119257 [Phanerochaete carnosa HHB-10118-sp]